MPKLDPHRINPAEHIFVRVLGFNGDIVTNNPYKDIVNGNAPKLSWEIHRLLWIGYYKNQDNDNCIFSQLSKDIIKKIIKFFLVDDNKFIKITLPQESTFQDITTHYLEYLHVNNKTIINSSNDGKNTSPIIHIWSRYDCICQEFPLPIDTNESKSETQQQLSKIKWVRIPAVYAKKLKLRGELMKLDVCNKICLEFTHNDFPYHPLSLMECLKLKINDYIDHRYVNLCI